MFTSSFLHLTSKYYCVSALWEIRLNEWDGGITTIGRKKTREKNERLTKNKMEMKERKGKQGRAHGGGCGCQAPGAPLGAARAKSLISLVRVSIPAIPQNQPICTGNFLWLPLVNNSLVGHNLKFSLISHFGKHYACKHTYTHHKLYKVLMCESLQNHQDKTSGVM